MTLIQSTLLLNNELQRIKPQRLLTHFSRKERQARIKRWGQINNYFAGGKRSSVPVTVEIDDQHKRLKRQSRSPEIRDDSEIRDYSEIEPIDENFLYEVLSSFANGDRGLDGVYPNLESFNPDQSFPPGRKKFEVGTKQYQIQHTIGDGNCAFNGFALGLMGLVSSGRLEEEIVKEKLGLSDFEMKTLLSNPQKIQSKLPGRLRDLAVEELKKDESHFESMQQAFLADLHELIATIEKAGNKNCSLEEPVKKFAKESEGTGRIFNYQNPKIRQTLLDSAQYVLQKHGQDHKLEESSRQAIDYCFEEMKKDKNWGGESELHALTKVFGLHLTTFSVSDDGTIRSDEGEGNAGHIPTAGWDEKDIETLRKLGLIEGRQSNERLYFKRLTREQVSERFNSHVETIFNDSAEEFKSHAEAMSNASVKGFEKYPAFLPAICTEICKEKLKLYAEAINANAEKLKPDVKMIMLEAYSKGPSLNVKKAISDAKEEEFKASSKKIFDATEEEFKSYADTIFDTYSKMFDPKKFKSQVENIFNAYIGEFGFYAKATFNIYTEKLKPEVESISKIYGRFLQDYSQSYKYSKKLPVEMGMFLERDHWSAVTDEQGFYDLNHDLSASANTPSSSNNTETSKMAGGYPDFV